MVRWYGFHETSSGTITFSVGTSFSALRYEVARSGWQRLYSSLDTRGHSISEVNKGDNLRLDDDLRILRSWKNRDKG